MARRFVDLAGLRGRHVLDLFSWSRKDIAGVLDASKLLKQALRHERLVYQPLLGRSMSMIFQKRSTRTRVSAEAGMADLGGHALFLGEQDIQLGKNESLRDTAEVLGRFNDIVLARVFGHADVLALAEHSTGTPVINALSDMHHPLQGLADLLTLEEHFGPGSLAGLRVAWVGDGNNILHTLLSCSATMGFHVAAATPRGYEPNASIVSEARIAAAATGTSIDLFHDPRDAVKGADVIVTDTWVSMGMESDKASRVKAFQGYQVTEAMAREGGAAPHWVFLHCLPRKPEEVDDEVFYSPKRSLVFPEAENRKWTIMALLCGILEGRVELPPATVSK